jgi:hydroxysqualene synthase
VAFEGWTGAGVVFMDNRQVVKSNMQASSTVQHYENFPVASFLCPPALRPPIAAIYWFARTADDIADEGDAPTPARLADLAAYRADLWAVAHGRAHSGRWAAVFGNLSLALAQHKLPVELLDDLLKAFEQDCEKTHYATQGELLDYCRHSANPVGRLLLHLYGEKANVLFLLSDDICTGLQLVNFWQDLSVDIARGRIYLPQDQWAAHGVTQGMLLAREVNPHTTALVRQATLHAAHLLERGGALCKALPGRIGWELRLVVQGGLRIAEKIRRLDYRSLQKRPTLTRADMALMLWRALWM